MKPVNLAFNAACHAMAARALPTGYSVAGIDSALAAPDTLEGLNATIAAAGRIARARPISSSRCYSRRW